MNELCAPRISYFGMWQLMQFFVATLQGGACAARSVETPEGDGALKRT